MKPSVERIAVAYVVISTLGVIATHTTNVFLATVAPTLAWPNAMSLAVAFIAAVTVLGVGWARIGDARQMLGVGLISSAVAAAALAVTAGSGHIPAALLIVGPVAAWAGFAVSHRLPARLDGAARRRRWLALAWGVLGVLTIVQTARLSTYMADSSYNWWLTTSHPFWSKHECMVAYIYGADLHRQGVDNVYAADLYPALNPGVATTTTLENFTADDPYQYPPQFLMLPALAIALSDDFHVIRAVWFGIQTLAFALIAFLLARWLGGRAGVTLAMLTPVLWVSVPAMLNFQYGQFHLLTIALAVAAFVAFESRRDMLGGLLLAASILAKGFPGILLLPLLMQRRWPAAAWTGAWMAGLTLLAWGVLGSGPFAAFFEYHMPRVRSGAAFAFEEVWPDLTSLLLAGNLSPHSLVRKLAELGVPGMTEWVARTVHGGYSILLIGAAVLAGRVQARERRAMVWLALVTMASLTSPAAWGDYVPVGSLWLLALIAAVERPTGAQKLCLGAAWVFSFLLPGVVPIGNFPSAVPAMILSIAGTLTVVLLGAWVIWRGVRACAGETGLLQIAP